tara:strand:+ start:5581 stop:5841 length:261 start_codon:yes stop_codon:yes gene_type:complete
MKIHDEVRAACATKELQLKEALVADIRGTFIMVTGDLARAQNTEESQRRIPQRTREQQRAAVSLLGSTQSSLPSLRAKLVESGITL